MTLPHDNLKLLMKATAVLKPLLDEIVFVGGCATGLLVTDAGAAAVRKTYDVDVIAEIASYGEYVLLRSVCERWVSRRIRVRAHRSADGWVAR